MSDRKQMQLRRGPIRHPADVATLRKALAEAGYSATDHDIQDAYAIASEDEYAASWMMTFGMADGDLVKMLLRHLEPANKEQGK